MCGGDSQQNAVVVKGVLTLCILCGKIPARGLGSNFQFQYGGYILTLRRRCERKKGKGVLALEH